MSNLKYGDFNINMFMAEDSAKSKEVSRKLFSDIGYEECYYFGGNDKSDFLEQFAIFWINLAILQEQCRIIAFKILKRP